MSQAPFGAQRTRRPGRKQLKHRHWLQVGCKSACVVYGDTEHCMRASPYSERQKSVCPSGTYTYLNDDGTLACPGRANYTVTFCGYLGAQA